MFGDEFVSQPWLIKEGSPGKLLKRICLPEERVGRGGVVFSSSDCPGLPLLKQSLDAWSHSSHLDTTGRQEWEGKAIS